MYTGKFAESTISGLHKPAVDDLELFLQFEILRFNFLSGLHALVPEPLLT